MIRAAAQLAGDAAGTGDQSVARRQIRGSSLLLFGRACSILVNLATQVIIVRSLAKTEYGALAYVLSLVEMGSLGAAFCMDKTFARFGAMYHERDDRPRFLGAWLLASTVPLVTSGLLIALAFLAREPISAMLQLPPATTTMLLLVVWLVPLNAIASVVLALATVVRGARTVFVRKHLVGPLLKLTLVVLAVAGGATGMKVAAALLAAGLCSLATDAVLALQIIRQERLWNQLRLREVSVPLRDFFGYSLPLLSSDMAYLARGTLMVVFLGWLASAVSTASFRAILPVVRLNELVIVNFTVMFMPLASRLFARGTPHELGDLYSRTRTWIAMLSFPVFAGCVVLSTPLTVLMFGDRYTDAASLLVILACGYYAQACYGFTGSLLRVLGHVKPMVVLDVLAATVALGSAWLLIPHWQAVGAAAAVSGGIAVHCWLRCMALRLLVRREDIPKTDRQPPLFALGFAVVLVSLKLAFNPGWFSGVPLVLLSTGLLWWTCRQWFDITSMFPEVRRLLGSKGARPQTTPRDSPQEITRGEIPPADNRPPRETAISSAAKEQPMRIAYIMSRFPKITETFVLREMVQMERLGVNVDVFPLQREHTSVIHPEAEPFVRRANFTPWISWPIARSCVKQFLRQPLACCAALITLLRANWGSRRYLVGAMLFFPKALHLAERMQQKNIDHVHAHFASHPAAVAWVIHRLAGIPYSFTAHGSDLHRDRHMLREKTAEAAAAVTISEYNRQLILEECPDVPADRVHVIHCGIDPRELQPRQEPTAYSRGEGPLQILCIGTLHEVKGQGYLLRACAELRRRGVKFHCHFVGDGPDEAALAEHAASLALTDNVCFHGRQPGPRVAELLQQADVLVAPSVPTRCGRREGIPVVLMEALGSGVPVVASDLSGIPELVRDGETGLLAPPRDASAIATAIERLAGDPALREQLARAGGELVEQEFNVVRNAAALQTLIESLRHNTGTATNDPAVEPSTRTTVSQTGEAACPC